MTIYRNCLVRPSKKNSEADQVAAIRATGPMDGKHAKTRDRLDDLLKSARRGELLVVAELQCMGDSLVDVMKALEQIQDKGLVLLESATGRQFANCYDGPAAGLAANEYFQRRSLSTMAAKRAGKDGAAKRWKDVHAGKVPLRKALQRWNRAARDGATKDEAIAAVNDGYEASYSYDAFMKLARDGKLPGRIIRLQRGARRKS